MFTLRKAFIGVGGEKMIPCYRTQVTDTWLHSTAGQGLSAPLSHLLASAQFTIE